MSANDGVNITHDVNHPFSGYMAIKVTSNCPWQVVLNWFCGKVSFHRSMFCLSRQDRTDLEKSRCQVCLQTHWRTCRGKRRRPQDCSSLRGSSPSSCKFLMELMISACMSLITPQTNTQCWKGGSEGGEVELGERLEKPTKGGRKRRKKKKKQTRKAGSDRTPLLGHLRGKHTTAVETRMHTAG